jgi:hypothetical protein
MRLTLSLACLAVAAALPADDEQPKPKEAERPPCHQVEGIITLDGKPLNQAVIVFHPDGRNAGQFEPKGETNQDGKFALTTFKKDDGAPAGKYRVTVGVPERDDKGRPKKGTDLLKGKYGDPKTAVLTVEVREGASEFNFDLRSR